MITITVQVKASSISLQRLMKAIRDSDTIHTIQFFDISGNQIITDMKSKKASYNPKSTAKLLMNSMSKSTTTLFNTFSQSLGLSHNKIKNNKYTTKKLPSSPSSSSNHVSMNSNLSIKNKIMIEKSIESFMKEMIDFCYHGKQLQRMGLCKIGLRKLSKLNSFEKKLIKKYRK
jgi:hypothetical protein